MIRFAPPATPWNIRLSKAFRKDVRRLQKAGADLRKLETLIDCLASDRPLDPRYRDHALTGSLAGSRDCHIAPDWILVYERDPLTRSLYLVRTGSHAHVFPE